MELGLGFVTAASFADVVSVPDRPSSPSGFDHLVDYIVRRQVRASCCAGLAPLCLPWPSQQQVYVERLAEIDPALAKHMRSTAPSALASGRLRGWGLLSVCPRKQMGLPGCLLTCMMECLLLSYVAVFFMC